MFLSVLFLICVTEVHTDKLLFLSIPFSHQVGTCVHQNGYMHIKLSIYECNSIHNFDVHKCQLDVKLV